MGNLSIDVSISAVSVFLQGFLSFFSPCVLPLLPLYIGYLSGGTGKWENGVFTYKKRAVLLHTFFFVIGISFTFFVLGLGVSAIGSFFKNSQTWITLIGGILILLFGLYQIGIFGSSSFLGKERRLPFRLDKKLMSPFTAFLMGFTFSFAWTPCVGPALASVLLMSASASTRTIGMLYIGVYTLGFVLPFLAVGMFAASLLNLFRKYMKVVQYTVKLGGVLLVVMGIVMLSGNMNTISGYFASLTPTETAVEKMETTVYEDKTEEIMLETEEQTVEETVLFSETETETVENNMEESSKESIPELPALDFSLEDQYGIVHTLEDYKGKTIFLNFWATWCPPCKAELPEIQQLYEYYQENLQENVVVLGVAAPQLGREGTREDIQAFLKENGYTYPVLMDMDAELFSGYGITSFPTTFMIDRNGNVYGYVTGQISYEIMEDIIRQTIEGVR